MKGRKDYLIMDPSLLENFVIIYDRTQLSGEMLRYAYKYLQMK